MRHIVRPPRKPNARRRARAFRNPFDRSIPSSHHALLTDRRTLKRGLGSIGQPRATLSCFILFRDWMDQNHNAARALVRSGLSSPNSGSKHDKSAISDLCLGSRLPHPRRSGLAGGDWWPCDHGPDLSRSFRALKTWFTLETYGLKALGDSIAANCALARRLAQRIERERALRLPAPVALNIVNHRTDETDIDTLLNDVLIFELQEELAAC